jgi:hypothetical protein
MWYHITVVSDLFFTTFTCVSSHYRPLILGTGTGTPGTVPLSNHHTHVHVRSNVVVIGVVSGVHSSATTGIIQEPLG